MPASCPAVRKDELTHEPVQLLLSLYQNVAVSGIGQEAYFNNGADARQLWVKMNEQVAFVVAFGDLEKEEGAQAIAKLLAAAIK